MAKKPPPKKAPRPVGRPTDYTPEIGDLICGLIATGRSLVWILENVEGMPACSTVYEWRRLHPEFAESYARAREDRADYFQEEMHTIADADPKLVEIVMSNGDPTGELKVDTAFEAWRKTRIDTRKWIMSRMLPKVYGDKIAQEHTGPGGTPLIDPNNPPPLRLFLDLPTKK